MLAGRFFTTSTAWRVCYIHQFSTIFSLYSLVFLFLSIQYHSFIYSCTKMQNYPLYFLSLVQFSSIACHVWLFVAPWTAARQASLSITNSGRLLKLMSIESVVPSNHLILCHPLLLLPSVFPSVRVFSNESILQAVKVLELKLQHQSFQWTPRSDLL